MAEDGDSSIQDKLWLDRVTHALALKNYAVSLGLPLKHDTLELAAKLDAGPRDKTHDMVQTLDQLVIELTDHTYPVTIDNISLDDEDTKGEYEKFKSQLVWFALGGVGGAILWGLLSKFSYCDRTGCEIYFLFDSLLAMSLGFLGAVVYSFFFALRVIPRQAFTKTDKFSTYGWLALGTVLGWICFFVFVPDAFGGVLRNACTNCESKPESTEAIKAALPFLVGYSTTLAISLFDRAIVAVQVALGLEEKRDPKLMRRRQG